VPYFTSVTRSGVRVSMPYGTGQIPCPLRFDTEEPIYLPVEAGQGIDLVAADVGSDCWAVCIGAGNDIGYLVRRRDRLVLQLGSGKVRGRYAVWISHGGDVSWIPDSNPYIAEHLNGSTELSRDTHHPLSPDERVIHVWGPVRVVQTYRDGPWMVGEDTTTRDGETRIFAKHEDEAPRLVWAGEKGHGYCPLPAHLAAHPDGSCTVAVQLPDGQSGPVFVHSSAFSIYAPPAVILPTFRRNPHRTAFVVDGAPGVPWFADTSERWKHEKLGVLWQTDQPGRDAHAALARETNRVFYAYADTPDPSMGHWSGIPNDVAWLPMVQLYPRKFETAAMFERRASGILELVASKPFAVYACGYTGKDSPEGARTEQQVLDGMGIVARLLLGYPSCRLVALYTWERGASDGVARYGSILQASKDWLASMASATDYPVASDLLFHVEPTPDQEPQEPAQPAPSEPKPPTPTPEPVPEPPAAPEPTPPVPVPVEPTTEPEPPQRPKRKTDKKPAIVGALVVLGGLLAKWFGRKKQ
jgi:hypothetical protein